MKKLMVLLLALVPIKAQAQAVPSYNNFAFNASSVITSWNDSDPANPPYPEDMGKVSLQTDLSGGYGSAISVPQQLGYLNHGELSPCDHINFDPKVWTSGDGTHSGDTFTQHGSTSCPYFTGEWGTYQNSNNRLDGFSVDANYVHTITTKVVCGRGGCVKQITIKDTLTGGKGTVTETTLTANGCAPPPPTPYAIST
jgi:hypothetical protein